MKKKSEGTQGRRERGRREGSKGEGKKGWRKKKRKRTRAEYEVKKEGNGRQKTGKIK